MISFDSMKVALVCPFSLDRPGGGQSVVANLANALVDNDVQVGVVAPGESAPFTDLHDAIQLELVGKATEIPLNGTTSPLALNPVAAKRVRRFLGDYDVVHVHEPLAPMVSPAAIWRQRAATVGTFHACFDGLSRVLQYSVVRTLRPLVRRLDQVTAVSTSAGRVLRRAGIDHSVVPNGVRVGDYKSRPSKTARQIVFVGRDNPRKGLGILLQAWPTINSACPGATLKVVGVDGPSDGGITYLGRCDERTKRATLEHSVILCAPNTGGESFGMVPLEGMAASCAVVASNLASFSEVVGTAGHFFEPGDVAGLVTKVTELFEDPEEMTRLGRQGHARAARFDWANVAAEYIDVYRDALRAHVS